MRKQKILFIITKSNFGGAQRYVFDLATSLPKETYEVVVAFGGSGLLKTKLEESGICTRTIQSFERDISIVKELRSLKEIYRIVREESPDIVHLNSSKAGGSGAFIARLLGVKKIVFTAHGWPFYENRNILVRLFIWFFSYLTVLFSHTTIVVSEHDARGAYMPFTKRKRVLITTALPPISFLERDAARKSIASSQLLERHQSDVWLVSTGEHTHNKNLFSLVRLMRAVRDRGHTNVFLTLCGDGELRASLESTVKAYALEDSIFFAGYVPEVRTKLQAFDIFLMPSLKEGFPYGVLEAGAAGCAVVASNVGGIGEIITHKVSGLLIDPDDEEGITTAVISLLEDAKRRSIYGEHLREHVLNTYTLAHMLEKTRAVYEKGSTAV